MHPILDKEQSGTIGQALVSNFRMHFSRCKKSGSRCTIVEVFGRARLKQ